MYPLKKFLDVFRQRIVKHPLKNCGRFLFRFLAGSNVAILRSRIVKYLAFPMLAKVEFILDMEHVSDVVTAFRRLKSISMGYYFSPVDTNLLGNTQSGKEILIPSLLTAGYPELSSWSVFVKPA